MSSFRFWNIKFEREDATRIEMASPPTWERHALLPGWIRSVTPVNTISGDYSVKQYYDLCNSIDEIVEGKNDV